MPTFDEVRQIFRDDSLTDKQQHYLLKQGARIGYVLDMIEDYRKQHPSNEPTSVLDIAPHLLTTAMKRHFGDGITINTLGWFDDSLLSREDVNEHFQLDLNDTNFEDRRVACGRHDLVVMGEIFEHLFACPKMTLKYIRSLVSEPNGRVILQTPNAVAIRNRLKMMLGRNPFEMIEQHRTGHVREYTMDELASLATKTGFEVEQRIYDDYVPERGLLRLVEKCIPRLQRRMTIVLSPAAG